MKPRTFASALILLLFFNITRADEGMWLLSLLEGYTIEDMQAKGFTLTANDIYSVNQACLKDAVVIFGGGCTGQMISGDGLVLTNHHCGYGAIQSHSSVENDYLTDGFWAMSREEELADPQLYVRFLRYMKDVGDEVFMGTEMLSRKHDTDSIIASNIAKIEKEANENGKYESRVSSMFYGNQYYLFVYERYSDVRLVGAPPSTIGNFGSDHDNWMWPRHTGDFSIFRVYANKDNEPSDYNADNVPYQPRKFFEISMDGVEKGDFTMLLGYPGSTQQFLYSEALKIFAERIMPLSVDIRTQRMAIMDRYMSQSDEVRIQYASKYRRVTNAWKKWQGAIGGLERLDAVEKKRKFETEFEAWVKGSPERTREYEGLLQSFDEIYKQMEEYEVINNLMGEAVFTVELIRLGSRVHAMMTDSASSDFIIQQVEAFYKDYYIPLDQEMFAAMMNKYREIGSQHYYPEFFAEVDRKFRGDFTAFADKVYSKSPLRSMESLEKFLERYEKNPSRALRKMKKDPVTTILNEFMDIYTEEVRPTRNFLQDELDELYKLWVQGRFQMQPNVRHYPDANFTMRLTYGEVDGYYPEDGVEYDYYTTLSGIIEKNNEGKHDYLIPDKLKDLYASKDYGDYGINGTMPVCFTASNHTSGGNSGSPVIDANGRLIGINFDRNWHGTMSDEMYDPDMCRNISVDIRYILFIIDKFAGAGYLLDEMKLVSGTR
ncbi:MAG: S46 family peptidase [Bacteroidales bacterium]